MVENGFAAMCTISMEWNGIPWNSVAGTDVESRLMDRVNHLYSTFYAGSAFI